MQTKVNSKPINVKKVLPLVFYFKFSLKYIFGYVFNSKLKEKLSLHL